MIEPNCLYRGISQDAIKNHLRGMLWFRSPAYFRDTEGVHADELEGIGSYEANGLVHTDIGDNAPIQPAFMISFSSEPVATRKFGKHYLVLNDPEELRKRVEHALPPKISKVSWRKIEYAKKFRVDRDLGASENWNRKFFSKPERFSGEKEWRLFVLFVHSFRLFNRTMKLHVGNLQGILDLGLHPESASSHDRAEHLRHG